jgi:flagellar protein FliJ
MARFIFNLEGVLRYRTHVEQKRQRDVAVVQAQLTALESELRALDAEVQKVNNEAREHHLGGRLEMGFLTAHRRFLGAAQRQAMDIAQKMATVQRRLDEVRHALAEAARDRKVLEKLKERQFEAWQTGMAKKEAAAMDEVGMQIAVRRLMET